MKRSFQSSKIGMKSPKPMVNGFTLPELLVASIIAVLVGGVMAQVMISQLIEERRLEVAQRIREDVSRLNYLIQIEASEAEQVNSDGSVIPTGCPVGGTDAFTLRIPRPTGTYADDSNQSFIRYYNALEGATPAIWRCGPPVSRNGVLIHNATPLNTAGVVLRRVQLERDPVGCDPSDDRNVTYRLVPPAAIAGSNLGELGGCVTAHARSVFVCNPNLDPLDPQIGDCPP